MIAMATIARSGRYYCPRLGGKAALPTPIQSGVRSPRTLSSFARTITTQLRLNSDGRWSALIAVPGDEEIVKDAETFFGRELARYNHAVS